MTTAIWKVEARHPGRPQHNNIPSISVTVVEKSILHSIIRNCLATGYTDITVLIINQVHKSDTTATTTTTTTRDVTQATLTEMDTKDKGSYTLTLQG